MQIWLIRHAVAEEPGDFGGPDFERPLTEKGKKRFRAFADWLAASTGGPAKIVSSPLVRAMETAELLGKAYDIKKRDILEESAVGPGVTAQALLECAQAQGVERLAIVGHQPDLAINTSALLGGGQVVFDKGCVAAIELPRLAVGSGRLLWFVGPKLGGD
ncbi:MAG: phosphohistidine phosphatase SixA [Planctomycetota bacterium]|nr:phosphohistidine phosphatase SixA [Planctomycetota bacterium]